ncbi:MAG: cupin [Rhodospirillales bacterium]|nr:cupin [Rhodospirillales bacterium]
MIWDCTAGRFNWFYDCDETVHVTEGAVILTTATGMRAVAAGDVIFFPAGSQATWQVDQYIRKIAFLRQTLPTAAGFALRVWKRLLRLKRVLGVSVVPQ